LVKLKGATGNSLPETTPNGVIVADSSSVEMELQVSALL